MENAICVKKLTLRYQTTSRRRSIRSPRFFSGKDSPRNIQALTDVSFTVRKGEILGIAGPNGSGKSTLLKVLAGVLAPDSGTVSTFGHSTALLSLGLGFHPELSGLDNIFLSGMLMGCSREEIQEKCQEILEFSQLGTAIYRPVNTYSGGMYSRLAFSIGATLKTDILLVDEVLSVGDSQFRQKSHRKMEELIRCRDTTVILVSHNLRELQNLCDRVLWLDRGRVRAIGPAKEILTAYQQELRPGWDSFLPTPTVTVTPEGSSVHLSWLPVEGAWDYRVYRKAGGPGERWELLENAWRSTQYTDTPPSGWEEYRYTVRARANGEKGPVWSGFIPSEGVKLKK